MVEAVCPECRIPSGAGAAGEETINPKKTRSSPNLQPSGACCQRSSFLGLFSWWRGEQRGQSRGFLPLLPPALGTSHRPPPSSPCHPTLVPLQHPRVSGCSHHAMAMPTGCTRRCQNPIAGQEEVVGHLTTAPSAISASRAPSSCPSSAPARAARGLELPGFSAGPPPARSPSAHFYSNVVYLVK